MRRMQAEANLATSELRRGSAIGFMLGVSKDLPEIHLSGNPARSRSIRAASRSVVPTGFEPVSPP